MIKSLAKVFLLKAGFHISRIPKHPSARQATEGQKKESLVREIAEDPLNARLHFQLACDALKMGKHFLAYAELKTAEVLGAEQEQIEKHATAFRRALPNLKIINHNQYFRFTTLATEIIAMANKSTVSILDVGGGQGELAAFLPDDFKYCLVEPSVNGISGTNLPFPNHSFDYVVSCHVLEHILLEERRLFLDQLLSQSKRGVILLNPFHVAGTHVDERLKLVVEITNAQWAKEHLERTLPHIDDIKDYATDRGLQFCAMPNGTLTTTLAFVFLDYFAAKFDFREDWEKITAFFNEKLTGVLNSSDYPTAYLMYLGLPEVRNKVAEQNAPEGG